MCATKYKEKAQVTNLKSHFTCDILIEDSIMVALTVLILKVTHLDGHGNSMQTMLQNKEGIKSALVRFTRKHKGMQPT